MMRIFSSFVVALCLAGSVNAQIGGSNLTTDLNGSPLKVKGKADVDGSPYFKPNFCEATLYGVDGRVYKDVRSKLNIQTNTVSFVKGNEEDKEYTPSFQVKRVEFTGCSDKNGLAVFQLGFPLIGVQDENSFYQVLDSGKTMLLKYNQIVETVNAVNGFTPGGGTTVLQKIETYYVYSPSKGMMKVSKSADDILKALGDKRTQVDNFIATNKMRIKKEDDLVKVIQYYNTLN